MSGGDKKTYESFLFVKDANLMTLHICGEMFLLQRETVVFYNWGAYTQFFVTQSRFYLSNLMFHLS